MVRKKAIKRLVWQTLLFLIGTVICGSVLVPVLVIYLIRAMGLGAKGYDAEANEKIKSTMTYEQRASYETSEVFVTIALPLLPYLLFTFVFPQFEEIANIIAFLTLFFLFFKPLAVDIVRIITNSERSTDKVKTIGNIGMVVLIIGCILYMIFFPIFTKAKLDHIEVWKDYVKEEKLDAELTSCMDDVEPEFFYKNTKATVKKELDPIYENGFIYTNTLYVHYTYDTETKEWSCTHNFQKFNTYELYETTSWTGIGKDMFYTLLFSDDKQYTFTINAGKLSEMTGTFTIYKADGTVMEECTVTCTESKENRYRLSFDKTLGNYIDSFIIVYDEAQNAFVFDDYHIEGTLIRK